MTDRPAIKPLEWVEHGDQDFVWHRATPPIGFRYNIEDDGFSEKKHHLTVGQLVIGNFDTLYEAKAAAQSDYASRIRSCLLDKPEAVEVDDSRAADWQKARLIAGATPVAERLPNDHCEVLAWVSDPKVSIYHVPVVARRDGKAWWAGIPGNYIALHNLGWTVTHWLPLRDPADTDAAQSGGETPVAFERLIERGQAFANQVRHVTYHLNGQAYSTTVSELNAFDADLRHARAALKGDSA